jgi:hypothetical protein
MAMPTCFRCCCDFCPPTRLAWLRCSNKLPIRASSGPHTAFALCPPCRPTTMPGTPKGLRPIGVGPSGSTCQPIPPFSLNSYNSTTFKIYRNFFAVAALKHYASLEGPHKETCAQMHEQLRNNLLENLAKQYEETGFLWEHYNDQSGAGEGNHPFTGWTAIILRILSNTY